MLFPYRREAKEQKVMDSDEFVFIQEMGTGSHRPITKSLIKMHVMDRVVMKRRSRKEESSHERDRTAKSNRKNQSPSIEQRIEYDNLRPMVGVDEMLRLSGFSIEVNDQTKSLLHHSNYQSQQNLLALKAAAIRTLASQFQRATPETGSDPVTFSDATIAAVACLANADFLCGNVEEAKVHFQGLRGMVQSRKGVMHLGFQGLAARIVKWTDSCHAQLSNATLSFDEKSLSFEATHLSSTLLGSQGLDNQPSRWVMMDELRSISDELIATPKHLMAPDRRAALGFRLLASDRSILEHIHAVNGINILAVLARGALLFSHVVLRGASRSSRIIRALVDQLKQVIIFLYTTEGDIFGDHPIVLVWLLLVGILASGRENLQGAWFRLCLEKACGSDTGLSWENVQRLIEIPNNVSPQPFHWMLEEFTLNLPCIRTSVLC